MRGKWAFVVPAVVVALILSACTPQGTPKSGGSTGASAPVVAGSGQPSPATPQTPCVLVTPSVATPPAEFPQANLHSTFGAGYVLMSLAVNTSRVYKYHDNDCKVPGPDLVLVLSSGKNGYNDWQAAVSHKAEPAWKYDPQEPFRIFLPGFSAVGAKCSKDTNAKACSFASFTFEDDSNVSQVELTRRGDKLGSALSVALALIKVPN